MLTPSLCAILAAATPTLTVTSDDTTIRDSCIVTIRDKRIADVRNDGVLQIEGDGLIVDFEGAHLKGNPDKKDPDAYEGIGVTITGRNITLRNLKISGYKVGILAEKADGLVLEDVHFDDMFRQRLRSTPTQYNDDTDFLKPHDNDNGEWMTQYGAAVYVAHSQDVTLRRIEVRNSQNGIVLDRVTKSRIYDNDCSFLSGWGLALWRSSGNTMTRNALDFCVRGYSHGVYNRGQDSAGLLLFEQCCDNMIAENSITHGGDGLFACAGNEALGFVGVHEDKDWYIRRGNNDNVIMDNDFSYAVAHGLELTFSFGNLILRNQFTENAICGIWAGYSQDTSIAWNTFDRNGDMPYGLERGGVNIEHGYKNRIQENRFRGNACGVHLWLDEDKGLAELPWITTNHRGSLQNRIYANEFNEDVLAVQLRQCSKTDFGRNVFNDVGEYVQGDDESLSSMTRSHGPRIALEEVPKFEVFGETRPVGKRHHLAGRKYIIMTKWGPYDGSSERLQLWNRHSASHIYKMLGPSNISAAMVNATSQVEAVVDPDLRTITVELDATRQISRYTLLVTTESGEQLEAQGVLTRADWDVTFFPWATDPREDIRQWRAESERGVQATVPGLEFQFGGGGPSDINIHEDITEIALAPDRFGTIARSTMTIPAGRWRIRTRSDDGIRVWLNDELVIDDWTHHVPTSHDHVFLLDETVDMSFRVEHFEIDGIAVLSWTIEPVTN